AHAIGRALELALRAGRHALAVRAARTGRTGRAVVDTPVAVVVLAVARLRHGPGAAAAHPGRAAAGNGHAGVHAGPALAHRGRARGQPGRRARARRVQPIVHLAVAVVVEGVAHFGLGQHPTLAELGAAGTAGDARLADADAGAAHLAEV